MGIHNLPNQITDSLYIGRAQLTEVSDRIKEMGITSAVFDRAGYLYHGRVKAVADGAREGGLEF